MESVCQIWSLSETTHTELIGPGETASTAKKLDIGFLSATTSQDKKRIQSQYFYFLSHKSGYDS